MNFFLLTAICFIQHVNSHIMKRDVEPIVFDNDDLAPVVAMHPEKPVQIEFDINVANMESVGLDFNVNISKDIYPCGKPSCSEATSKPDACSSAPCENHGSCNPLTDDTFNCSCVPGYVGDTCETNIDECASVPCLNEGICTDLTNDFSCSCVPGYVGDTCETNIDECASVPCLNEGNCTDLTNDFSCSCNVPWTGQFCDMDIDDCASSPCIGGECKDEVNNYRCECLEHWSGPNCDRYSIDLNDRGYTLSSTPTLINAAVANLIFNNNDEIRMYQNEVESLYEVYGDDIGWIWTDGFRYGSDSAVWIKNNSHINPEINIEEDDSLASACLSIYKIGYLKEFPCDVSHYTFIRN